MHLFLSNCATMLAVSLCLLLRITRAGSICGCEHRTDLLMELYNATSGPQWTNKAGWGTSSPCSTSWFGVTCGGSPADITHVDLRSNNLRGTLPASWGSMSKLQQLYLFTNSLSGTLPSSWSSMSIMQNLQLSTNSLNGTLPASWASITGLQYLYLLGNSLSGTLPSLWASMSSMQLMHLASNNLSGTLPSSWSSMSSLRNLALSSNILCGNLPASWFFMSSLQVLSLNSNCLYGSVPPSYTALVPHLDAGGVRLCGTNVTGGAAVLGAKLNACGSGGDAWPANCVLTNCTSSTASLEFSVSASSTSALSSSRSRSRSKAASGSHTPTKALSGSRSAAASLSRTPGPTSSASQTPSPSMTPSISSVPTPSMRLSTSPSALRTVTCSPSPSPTISALASSASQTMSGPTLSATYSWSNATSTSLTTTASTAASLSATNHCSSPSATAVNSPTETSTQSTVSTSGTASISATHSTWVCTVDAHIIVMELTPPQNSELRADTRSVTTLSFAAGSFGAVQTTEQGAVATVVSAPIQRSVLATIPDLAFNLTIVAPPSATRWAIAHIAMGGQRLNFTALSTNTAPWHSVVVGPPSPQYGWLAPGTALLVDRTVALRVVLSCDGVPVLAVDLTVPAPGIPREFAGRIVAATKYSQLASVLAGGATSGTAVGRTMATRSMVMCDADAAVSGGVLDLGLTICAGESAPNAASVSARSAVVSNLVLVGSVASLLLLLATLWTHLRSCSLRSALREMSLPSTLLPVCTVVLPTTAASSTLLAARHVNSACTVTDTLLVLCGASLVMLPTAMLLAVWRARARGTHPSWVCVSVDDPASAAIRGNDILLPLRNAFNRRWKWTNAARAPVLRRTNCDDLSTQQAIHCDERDGEMRSEWVLLLEYRVLWYAALDSFILPAVAALAVGGGLDTSNSKLCLASGALVVVLIAAQLVVLALTRPFTTLFALVHAALSLSLTCLSAASQLVFVQVSTDSSGLWLAHLSAACDLAVVGVTSVRVLFDLTEIAAAIRRRFLLLWGTRLMTTPPPCVPACEEMDGGTPDDDPFCEHSAAPDVPPSEDDSEPLDDDDL